MNKKELRKQQLQIRKNFSMDIKNEEIVIQENTYRYICENDYEHVLIYVSTKEELDTHILIDKLINKGISVYVPRVYKEEMSFYKIESFDDLEKGYMGILEPKENCEEIQLNQRLTYLVLTPGLLFDTIGNRLGYGGGYYDRYLSKLENGGYKKISLGLCFSPFLCTDTVIPSEVTDVALDGVITKDQVIMFKE